MNDEKYRLEKEQIAEAEKALSKAKEDFEAAKESYGAAADSLITELEEFTRKKKRRIRFVNV